MNSDQPIYMNFPKEILDKHILLYFQNSLRYYPEKYINLVYNHHQIVEEHFAYLCPLCLKSFFFIRNGPSLCNDQFSEDHYPPKCAGGVKTMLVCRTCNSKAGHEYDFELGHHVGIMSYNKHTPNAIMPMKYKVEGLPGFANGKLTVQSEGVLELSLKKKESDKIKAVDEWLKKTTESETFSFTIKPKDADMKKVHRAVLHAAYLYCFEFFGYEFVFSKSGEFIRRVMSAEENYPVDVTHLSFDSPEMLKILPEGLSFIDAPPELKGFAVNIPLTDKNSGYKTFHIVLIPDPTNDGIDNLRSKADFFKSYKGTLQMTKPNEYLPLNIPNAYSQSWHNLSNPK